MARAHVDIALHPVDEADSDRIADGIGKLAGSREVIAGSRQPAGCEIGPGQVEVDGIGQVALVRRIAQGKGRFAGIDGAPQALRIVLLAVVVQLKADNAVAILGRSFNASNSRCASTRAATASASRPSAEYLCP